jgi:hypothetical protein
MMAWGSGRHAQGLWWWQHGLRLRNAHAATTTDPELRPPGRSLNDLEFQLSSRSSGLGGRGRGRCGAVALRRVLPVLSVGALISCNTPDRSMEIRQWTDDLSFRISVSPTPPVAEGDAVYKIIVQDKNTRQPIEAGQGRIFASNREQAKTDDGLAKGKEVGTYYAHLRFPVSGEWAIGLQFRRDSTLPLERTQDWVQTVSPAPELGSGSKTFH